MKLIKTLFLISLFNLFIVGSVVLAFKSGGNETILPIAIPTDIPAINQTPTTVLPTTASLPTAVKVAPTTDPRCIITVDGVKYDISQYQYQHSGGDIFQCGTDMSSIFHNRHSNRFLQYMQQFRI